MKVIRASVVSWDGFFRKSNCPMRTQNEPKMNQKWTPENCFWTKNKLKTTKSCLKTNLLDGLGTDFKLKRTETNNFQSRSRSASQLISGLYLVCFLLHFSFLAGGNGWNNVHLNKKEKRIPIQAKCLSTQQKGEDGNPSFRSQKAKNEWMANQFDS